MAAARFASTLAATALLLGAGLLPACEGTRARADFDVVLVVLDACRADKLGHYGFPRPTSPEWDALAEDPDAVVFRRHYVQASWTKPSTATLFSGLFPHEHGVQLGHRKVSAASERTFATQVLSQDVPTLAEALRKRGFETFAVVRNPHLGPEYGFHQGFERYLSKADTTTPLASFRELIDGSRGRFFGYLHVHGCHLPYVPAMRDAEYFRKFRIDYDAAARRAAGVDFTSYKLQNAIRDGRVSLDDADVAFLNLEYEARVRHVDRTVIGPLIRLLRESGRYDDSLLVVTSDHGEELYDHRRYGHGHALWDELIRVPLLIKFPKGRRPAGLADGVSRATNSVDLAPSLLALVDASPRESPENLGLLGGSGRGYAFSESVADWALVKDGYKLVETGEGPRLFDTARDPGETVDLAPGEPARVEAMRAFAGELRREATEAPVIETELEPAALEQLRSLGYLD